MKKMNGFFNDTSRHNENWNFIFLWFCILKANNNQKVLCIHFKPNSQTLLRKMKNEDVIFVNDGS